MKVLSTIIFAVQVATATNIVDFEDISIGFVLTIHFSLYFLPSI